MKKIICCFVLLMNSSSFFASEKAGFMLGSMQAGKKGVSALLKSASKATHALCGALRSSVSMAQLSRFKAACTEYVRANTTKCICAGAFAVIFVYLMYKGLKKVGVCGQGPVDCSSISHDSDVLEKSWLVQSLNPEQNASGSCAVEEYQEGVGNECNEHCFNAMATCMALN